MYYLDEVDTLDEVDADDDVDAELDVDALEKKFIVFVCLFCFVFLSFNIIVWTCFSEFPKNNNREFSSGNV